MNCVLLLLETPAAVGWVTTVANTKASSPNWDIIVILAIIAGLEMWPIFTVLYGPINNDRSCQVEPKHYC